jgi:hypothetical protein
MILLHVPTPQAVQLLQVKNRLEWQEKLSGVPLDGTRTTRGRSGNDNGSGFDTDEDISVSTFIATKYRASHRRAYISMALMFLVMFMFTLGYSLYFPVYYKGCVGCDLSLLDFVLFSGTLIGCATFIFVTAWRVPKPVEGQAEHPLVHQIKVIFFRYFPLYLAYMAVVLSDPGELHTKAIFSYNHLGSLILTTWLFYTSAYPGLRAQRYKGKMELRLIDVIRDPVLLALFENHLKAEFSLENLRFYFEATVLRRQFPRGPGFAQREMEEWRQKALDVYSTFVTTDGLLSLNLSSETRSGIEKGLGIAKSDRQGDGTKKNYDIQWGAMGEDLFDAAITEGKHSWVF